MLRLIGTVLCALMLVGCSPDFDWRVTSVGDGMVTGVLPGRPHTETRAIGFDGQTLDLSLTMAEAKGVLFALGHAVLPEAIQGDRQAARVLANEVVISFYRNLGAPLPDPLPALGTRFIVRSEGAGEPVSIEALVGLSGASLIEAVVMGKQRAVDRAPVQDFWSALKTAPLE